jgi:hypothetical protein
MARYEAGETLSSIARTYDCSPPAISYVVSRSRARQPGQAQPPSEAPRSAAVGEPQLIKASAVASSVASSVNGGGGGDHASHREPAAPTADAPPAQTSSHAAHGAGNGFERTPWATREPQASDLFPPNHASAAPRAREHSPQHTAPPQHTAAPQHAGPHATTNGDPRARLHLHLGDASHANGAAAASDPRHADQAPAPQRQPQPQGPNGGGYRPAWANAGPQPQSAAPEPQHQRPAASIHQPTNHQPAPPNHHPAPPQHTNGGHSGNGGRP